MLYEEFVNNFIMDRIRVLNKMSKQETDVISKAHLIMVLEMFQNFKDELDYAWVRYNNKIN